MRRPRGRGVAALIAILALSLAGGAEAKKKKNHKKHKTPWGKASKSSHRKAAPAHPAEPEEQTTPRPGGGEKKAAPEENAPVEESGSQSEGRSEGKSEGRTEKTTGGKKVGASGRPKHVDADTAEAEPEGAFALPALDVVVGAGAVFRNLSWNQDVTSSFAPYKLSPGPELRLAIETFPAAFATTGFAANVGLFGAFNYGVAVTSKVQSTGMKLTTSFQDFLIGVKVRLPFGNLVPYASAAYGGQSFRLSGQNPLTVPSVDYKFLRFGLGARFWVTPAIDVDGGAAVDAVTDLGKGTGDIASPAFLPQASGYAVDFGVSIGVRLTGPFGLRFGGDFRQYGISGNSHTTDMVRVGGAADRYVTGWGGLEVIFDGPGGAVETQSEAGSEAGGQEGLAASPGGARRRRPGQQRPRTASKMKSDTSE